MTDSSPTSATEKDIKRRGRRRLIGAIVLAMLAVVVLPMIFDPDPNSPLNNSSGTQEISIRVPTKEDAPPLPAPTPRTDAAVTPPAATMPAPPVGAASTPTAPAPTTPTPTPVVPAPVAPAAATVPADKPTVAPEKAKPESAPAPKPVEKPAPAIADKTPQSAKSSANKPESATATEPSKPAATKPGFAIQVGVFSNAANAKHVIAQMKEAKLPVYQEKIKTASGTALRIRVGPFASRGEADAALAQVKLAGSEGKVLPLP